LSVWTAEKTVNLVVGSNLAVVADELEAADHLTNGEESEALGKDNATSNDLGGIDIADLLEQGLWRLEDGSVLHRGPQVLVKGLEGGGRAARASQY
jgi:hypothetical protein